MSGNDLMGSGFGDHGYCKCRSARATAGSGFGGSGAFNHYPPDLELEPVHIDITIALDLEAQSAVLEVQTTVTANRAGAKKLELNAVGMLDLAASCKEAPLASASYDGKLLRVVWDKPLAQGEKRVLTTRYRVEKPLAGLYFRKPTGVGGHNALYAATDHETELCRYWLTAVDLPNVRTTLAFHITAKKELEILANGALLATDTNKDGTKTVHWRLDQRCPSYLICFAVGDFSRFDDGVEAGLPLAYFACKDFSPKDLERSFGRTRPMLQWITKKLDYAFPFPKYFQFALPGFDGAMENISLVSWSDRFLIDEGRAAEGTWLMDQINIHEMAHSYFGDLVVCRDFAHAWLKESWATYIETCWLEDSQGVDEQQYDLFCNAEAYFEEADESYQRPLVTRHFTSSRQMYDRHLYPGGGCRLHTLRRELGDEIFWQGVRQYLKTFAGKVVETDDFRRSLEAASGRTLQKFFDQWVHTAAYPKIKVSFDYDEEKKLGTFEVEQTQVDQAKGIPAFEMTVDLSWTLGTQAHERQVHLLEAKQSFSFAMDKDPEQVRFDPNWRALHKLTFDPGTTRLKAQLTGAKDVVGRIQAAALLVATGQGSAVTAVAKAYAQEKFWGVKREMIRALVKSQSEDAVVALVALVKSEQDALVLPSLLAAVGKLRDPRIVTAVVDRVAAGGLAPIALANALESLGGQRGEAPLAVLRQAAAASESRYGFAQAAAFVGLGKTWRAEVLPELQRALQPGATPARARPGVIRGLSALAPQLPRGQRSAIEETLADLLRDGDSEMRRTAAKALCSGWAEGGEGPVMAYRARLPLQEQVALDEYMQAHRTQLADGTAKLTKEMETLVAKQRALGDKVRELLDQREVKESR